MEKLQHLVDIRSLDTETIKVIFDLARRLQRSGPLRDKPLAGRIMMSLFYQPSTRTRMSFESAMKRLGGEVIGTENAKEFSSAIKGETLEDSIKVVRQYGDIIVLRHDELGAAKRAAAVSSVPVINAGDGPGQHPTQGLLDLNTICHRFPDGANGLVVAFVGDLQFGRTVHSLAYLLGKYQPAKIYFVSSEAARVKQGIKTYLTERGIAFEETDNLQDVMRVADVVYQTRVQESCYSTVEEYMKVFGLFVINRDLALTMKPGAILMHPLPRKGEITTDVDDLPQAVYLTEQIQSGLYVRMSLLLLMLGC